MTGSVIQTYQSNLFTIEENKNIINDQLSRIGFIAFDRRIRYMGCRRSERKKIEHIVHKHMIEDGSKELCLVCRKRNGGHIQSRAVDQFMKALSKRIGFHCTSHISRHTHATLLLEEGANIANISARLGHNGSEITMQYLHSTKDADYDISNRVEKAILSTE